MKLNEYQLVKKLGVTQFKELADLVDDLGWDYQRMTTSGRATYKKLCNTLGWEFEWNDEEIS